MKMKAYIPGTLSFENNKQRDKYYFLLTSIYYGRILDKRNVTTSYISLHSKTLAQMLGGRYIENIRFLLSEEIIETDNQYIEGEKSKGYRLTRKYATVKHKQVFITDKKLIKKIKMFNRIMEKQITMKPHKYIYECLKKVEIEYDDAKYFIERNMTQPDEYIYSNISIDLIEAKNYFFTVDSTAGRVHNNITNLSRKLRPFLRYRGEKLVEIDLANSQPFLFNILINEYLCKSRNFNNSQGGKEGGSVIYPYGNQNDKKYEDIERFKELTSKGLFYEYLMDELGVIEDRSAFKVRFFSRVFFSQENLNYVSEERELFERLFPNVNKIVKYYKREDYCELAIKLQIVEADIMINHVVPRLAEKNIYVLTIHDSILTLRKHIEFVKQTILKVFNEKYGLEPKLKEK